jgi:hypothetical protein
MGTENDVLIRHKMHINSENLESSTEPAERLVRALLLLGFLVVLVTEGWLLIQALDVYF